MGTPAVKARAGLFERGQANKELGVAVVVQFGLSRHGEVSEVSRYFRSFDHLSDGSVIEPS
jgi:hypothetical protein